MTPNEKINNLIARRAALRHDLQTVEREIEDAQSEAYRIQAADSHIVQQFVDGYTVVVSFGRHFWVDPNGDLGEQLSESEIEELKRLAERGVFVH